MKAMEKKILEEGKVLPGGILKVGSFLNQQIDTSFLGEMAKEFARLYADAGVREYWIVDPKRETVLCYYFEGEDYPHMYTFDDIIPVMIYDGKLEINFADIKDRLI